eukprot:SAG31_NODE_2076_length_6507_cov_3.611267_1_plen_45_part_10
MVRAPTRHGGPGRGRPAGAMTAAAGTVQLLARATRHAVVGGARRG